MKSGLLSHWVLAAAVGGVCLTCGCLEKSSTPPPLLTMAAAEVEPDATLIPVAYDVEAPSPSEPLPALDVVSAPVETNSSSDVVNAPATPVSKEKTLPANVRLSGPAMEIVKLADSGVEEAVLMSYVTNSISTFDLGADEIIYLTDIGVPGEVVSAMIQHDQGFRLAAANAAAAPAQPGPPAPLPGYPAPAEVAPQPEPSAADYPPLTPPSAEVSYGDFYDNLAPYGTWIDVEGYGRCWQPTVVVINPGWQPYFDNGCWAYTDCGWYWHSGYSWGWAPFHYGRWFRHGSWGWCWAPDTVWGPSWVCWRQSNAYCGWAPLPPGCYFTAGIGFTFHGQRVNDFFDYGLRPHDYRFVAWNHFHDRHLRGRGLPQHDADQVFNKTTVANRIIMNNNTVINQGIAPQRVANASQHEVRQVALLDRVPGRQGVAVGARTAVQQHTVAVYRPERRQPDQDTGTVAGGSGVPMGRPGSAQSASSTGFAPAAGSAPRMAGAAGITPPRPVGRLTGPGEEAQLSIPPERGPSLARGPGVAPAPAAPLPPQSPTVPVIPQRPLRLPGQIASAPATTTPAQNPYARPGWTQPSVPSTQPNQNPNTSRATPWLNNRPATQAPAQVQPQYTPPAYVPQRPYTLPPPPSVPLESRPAPSRPVMAEVPRYAPPSVPSRPAVSEAPRYSPPAPSAPPAPSVQARSAPPAQSAPAGSSPGNAQRR